MPRVNDPFERQHIANLSKYAKIIDEIFKTAAKEAASIGVIVGNGNFDASRVFSFADYPITHKMIQSLLSRLANSVETANGHSPTTRTTNCQGACLGIM